MQLQGMAKLKGRVPSDEVEELAFRVQWIPIQATGGAALSTKDTSSEGLAVVRIVFCALFRRRFRYLCPALLGSR